MVGSIWKSRRECMAYPKQGCWLINCSCNDWPQEASIHAYSLQGYGSMPGNHNLCSHCWWLLYQIYWIAACAVSLQQDYDLAIDQSGTLFCGITLTWDYTKWTVILSMPVYIAKALTKFQHSPPFHPQHLPHKHNPTKYCVQVPLPKDTAPLL